MRITNPKITELKPNEVFVFGANTAGIHGAGAARLALNWGAKWKEYGFNGQTYGIPTKDDNIETLILDEVNDHVQEFIEFAKTRPDLIFLVTEIGCGLAGFEPSDIAPLFKNAVNLENIYLPERFWKEL